jgi:hypothetical protein
MARLVRATRVTLTLLLLEKLRANVLHHAEPNWVARIRGP